MNLIAFHFYHFFSFYKVEEFKNRINYSTLLTIHPPAIEENSVFWV